MSDLIAGPEGDAEMLVLLGVPRKAIFAEDGSADYSYIPSGKPRRTHAIDKRPVPRFTRDIAAAWLVVEHLRARGWFFDLGDRPIGDDLMGPRVWTAYINRTIRGPDADTPALAICRAAKAALEQR